MNAHVPKTAAETAYLDAAPTRPEALRRFAAKGLPNRRVEEWRWTDLRQFLDRPYPPAVCAKPDSATASRLMAASPFAALAPVRLAIVDGVYAPELSAPPAADEMIVSWSDTVAPVDTDEALEALNASFVAGTLSVKVPEGQGLARLVEIVVVTTAASAATYSARIAIDIGAGASLRLIQTHVGAEGAYVALPVTTLKLGDGARCDRVKVQEEAAGAKHLASDFVDLGASAILRDYALTVGGALARNEVTLRFLGEGGDARLAGSYLIGGRQHCDTQLVVDHRVPHCTSREVFKVVIDDEARGIFQGKVIVRPGAQKTDGKQSSHALLLTPEAEFDAKPELEIFADDVVCGHGATAGDLEEDHLFYLRARGIPEAEAKALLIEAFVADAFGDEMEDAVRDTLAGIARDWLARRGKAA
ncbi:MAG: Fe-S cluster assembly protein SufD [Hyphomicrobiales bacterium]